MIFTTTNLLLNLILTLLASGTKQSYTIGYKNVHTKKWNLMSKYHQIFKFLYKLFQMHRVMYEIAELLHSTPKTSNNVC